MGRVFVVGDQLKPIPPVCLRCGRETADRLPFTARGTVPLVVLSPRPQVLKIELPICGECARRRRLWAPLATIGYLLALAVLLAATFLGYERGFSWWGHVPLMAFLAVLGLSRNALNDLIPWLSFRVQVVWMKVAPLRVRLRVGNDSVARRLAESGVQSA